MSYRESMFYSRIVFIGSGVIAPAPNDIGGGWKGSFMKKRAVACSNCGAKGSIDLGKFKTDQFTLRCPKCGEHFLFAKERRNAPRKVPLPIVKIGPYGFDFEIVTQTGVLMDISTTGIRVGVKKAAPKKGDRLNFKFSLPGIEDMVHLGGEVAWVRKSPESGLYEFGVEYVALDQYNRKTIGFYMFSDDEYEVLEMELDRPS